MSRLLTAAEIGARIGCSASEVRRLARARGIEPAMVAGRSKLWSPRIIGRFARRDRGRPRKETR